MYLTGKLDKKLFSTGLRRYAYNIIFAITVFLKFYENFIKGKILYKEIEYLKFDQRMKKFFLRVSIS